MVFLSFLRLHVLVRGDGTNLAAISHSSAQLQQQSIVPNIVCPTSTRHRTALRNSDIL
jgi:hypothetical protein